MADPRGFETIVHQLAKQFFILKHGVFKDPRLKLNKVINFINELISIPGSIYYNMNFRRFRKNFHTKVGVIVIREDESVHEAKYVIGLRQPGCSSKRPHWLQPQVTCELS